VISRPSLHRAPAGDAAAAAPTDLLRRLDGRFLLPPPPDGAFAHLVILGGPPGLAEVAEAAGIARRVSAGLPPEGSADALFLLRDARVAPERAARCLASGGCAWLELESRRWAPRKVPLRVTGRYAVLPGFERSAAYVPADPPGPRRWYAETLQPAWTLGKALRRAASKWGRDPLARSFALTAVAGRESQGPASMLDHPALPSWLRGLHPLLLAHGPDRVVVLPFAPGASSPAGVLKVPRLPLFNDRTEGEQALLAHLRARLDRVARSALPEPRGVYPGGGLAMSLESYAAGRPLAQRMGGWGEPLRNKLEDLREATEWLAGFHRRTEVRRAEWGAGEAAEWIDGPLGDFGQAFGAGAALDRLTAAVRRRSGELAGAALPVVCRHRDFTPWNLLRGDGGLRVIDWEGARPGPALCDLLHFSTHWSELALRTFDEGARLRVFREVWIARRGGEPGEAVRRRVAAYCEALRLDRRFVPLLLVATWVELALRQGLGSREASYVGVLAAEADGLFGAWNEAGWR
jgi:Ser/Thr protein kinase RdoA (MazF antagonist)